MSEYRSVHVLILLLSLNKLACVSQSFLLFRKNSRNIFFKKKKKLNKTLKILIVSYMQAKQCCSYIL